MENQSSYKMRKVQSTNEVKAIENKDRSYQGDSNLVKGKKKNRK